MKGNIGTNSVQNVIKANNIFRKIGMIFVSIILALSLVSCKKPTEKELMQEWKDNYDDAIREVLNEELDYTFGSSELISAVVEDGKTRLQSAFEYTDDRYVVVTPYINKEYDTLKEIMLSNEKVKTDNLEYIIIDEDEYKPDSNLVNLLKRAFGNEAETFSNNITSPADGFAIVNEKERKISFLFSNENKYYQIVCNEDMPDQYFADYQKMLENYSTYIKDTKVTENVKDLFPSMIATSRDEKELLR